jgi:tetratricopeptide (TPR) repeat protein
VDGTIVDIAPQDLLAFRIEMNKNSAPNMSKPGFLLVLLSALVIGGFCCSGVESAFADEPTVEEEAALLLFKEGKDLFKGGRYAAALMRFENAAKVVKKEVLTFYLGRTYVRLGRCGEALHYLSSLAGKVPPEAERLRLEGEKTCLWTEAKRLIADDDCVGAFPHLQNLSGRLSKEDEKWRLEKEQHCGPRSTAFDTGTTRRKAAHQIFLEARKARDANNLTRAAELLEKVGSLVDDLVIHEERFDVLVRLGRWSQAAAVAEPIADLWFHSDGQDVEFKGWWLRVQACSDYPPVASVRGDDAVRYVADVLRILTLNPSAEKTYLASLGEDERVDHGHVDLGALDKAQIDRMEKALVVGQSTPLFRSWLDALVRSTSCSLYLRVRKDASLRRILPEQHRAPDANCAPKVVVGAKNLGIRSPTLRPKRSSWRSTLGWSLVTSSVLFAGGGGYFTYQMLNDIDDMERAVDEYNALPDLTKVTSFGNALASEAEAANVRATGNRNLVLIFSGAAALTLSAGIYFLVRDAPTKPIDKVQDEGETSTIRWTPVIGPTGGGIIGWF